MKQYLIAIYQPDGVTPPPDVLDKVMAEIGVLRAELQESGQWVFGNGLHGPESATVLHVREGELFTTDGPYVEGKEHLGGFTIITAPDLDDALRVGRRYAEITKLPIEVRPFHGEAG